MCYKSIFPLKTNSHLFFENAQLYLHQGRLGGSQVTHIQNIFSLFFNRNYRISLWTRDNWTSGKAPPPATENLGSRTGSRAQELS